MHVNGLPVSECVRLVADALNESVVELRRDNDTRMLQCVHTQLPGGHVLTWCCRSFQEELRKGEEKRLAQSVFLQVSNGSRLIRISSVPLRFEKAVANLKPAKIKTDPTTNFWTVYKKVADEYDDDLVAKYVGDLDTSLLFVSTFISLARPMPQPELVY